MKIFRKSIWILTLFLISVPVIAFGIVHWYQTKFEKLPVFGGYDLSENGLTAQHIMKPFEMLNQDGKVFSSVEAKNKIIIANFFFTSCAGICLDMMKHIKRVQHDLAQDKNLCFISFTVDPSTDSASRLKEYSERYNINWSLLTGDKKSIYRMARKSFFLSVIEGDGGENDFIHSEQLVLIDKNNHIRGYYNGTDDKAMVQLKQDIQKLEYEN